MSKKYTKRIITVTVATIAGWLVYRLLGNRPIYLHEVILIAVWTLIVSAVAVPFFEKRWGKK